jgi:hypothetical protein
MADNHKGIYFPKTLIGEDAYKKAGPKGRGFNALLRLPPDANEEDREKMNKAMFEADDEVRRETKGATGNESMGMSKYRQDREEKRRETRGKVSGLDKPLPYKKGGSVGSASKRADGCAIRGKTRGKMV